MTKFEEEVKRPVIGIGQSSIKPALGKAVEFYTDKVKEYHNAFSDMNKYIDVIENALEKKDEEIANLKSQLQQQALPVVPECVAEWIEILKSKGLKPLKNPETYGETGFTEKKLQNIVFWISEHQEDYMRAWLDGYTVEKTQLFRVCLLDGRHTLTRRDPRKTLPFNYTFLWSYSSELKEMREINRKVDLFTEQEIKSIDERYWQFAVPVEDGE